MSQPVSPGEAPPKDVGSFWLGFWVYPIWLLLLVLDNLFPLDWFQLVLWFGAPVVLMFYRRTRRLGQGMLAGACLGMMLFLGACFYALQGLRGIGQ